MIGEIFLISPSFFLYLGIGIIKLMRPESLRGSRRRSPNRYSWSTDEEVHHARSSSLPRERTTSFTERTSYSEKSRRPQRSGSLSPVRRSRSSSPVRRSPRGRSPDRRLPNFDVSKLSESGEKKGTFSICFQFLYFEYKLRGLHA